MQRSSSCDLANDERQPIRPARLTERRSHGSDVVPRSERALGLTFTRSESPASERQQRDREGTSLQAETYVAERCDVEVIQIDDVADSRRERAARSEERRV